MVVDPNVYVSGALGSTSAQELLLLLQTFDIAVIYSHKLYLELQQTILEKPYVADLVRPEQWGATKRFLARCGTVRRDPPLRNTVAIARDRNDDYLLELARTTGSMLITGDQKMARAVPPEIPVVSLREAIDAFSDLGGVQVVLGHGHDLGTGVVRPHLPVGSGLQ